MWRVRRQGVAREPQERDTTADEAFMGAAAEGIGGFEILDETVERVKTRFQQFLVEQYVKHMLLFVSKVIVTR